MTIARYQVVNMQCKDLESLVRLAVTISSELESSVLPILAFPQDDKWRYQVSILHGLKRSRQILFNFYVISDKEPKNFARINDAPKEEVELRDDTLEPVGVYIPILKLLDFPGFLIYGNYEKKFDEFDYEVVVEKFKRKDWIYALKTKRLSDLVRISIEQNNGIPAIFHVPQSNIFFTIIGEYEVGDETKLFIYFWEGEMQINGYYLTIDDQGNAVAHPGKLEPLYSYASFIPIKKVEPQMFLEVFT